MAYRQLPTASRRIGFEIQPPSEVELQTGEVVCCRERRADGKTVGELEVRVFQAALVIDRDGILEEKMEDAVSASEPGARVTRQIPVAMPGASGYRADIVVMQPPGGVKPALPYVYVFAMAPNDLALDGGLIVTVRSASPEWPAADKILRSLKILSRRGASAHANDRGDDALQLPLLGQRDDD